MRARDIWLSMLRLGFATAGVAAMMYQFAVLNERGSLRLGNFFGFFTIQSNIFAVLLLMAAAMLRKPERTVLFDFVRGGVTLYVTITGVIFALLLDGHQEAVQTATPWVDVVVHRLMPIVVLADWLIDGPRYRLPLRSAVWWLLYPAAWFTYTLFRGASVHWYPYPFVDVSTLGYGGVFERAGVLLVCFALAALAFVWVGNRLLQRRGNLATGTLSCVS